MSQQGHAADVPTAKAAREVGPGGTVRFAVGSRAGLRSSTWRVWSAKNTTDVYVAARSIADVQKISLHKTGSWSHSFVSHEKAAPFVPPGASRHLTIWQRPPQFGEGWTRGYVVIVPWTELRRWPEPEKGDIVFAPDPGNGRWVHIEIVFVDAGTTTRLVFDEEMYLLGSLTLVDGSEVKVIARKVRPAPDEARRLAAAREEVIAHMRQSRKEMIAEFNDPSTRIGVHGNQTDGTRFCVDLALQPPPPGQAVICTGLPESMPPEPS
jgi:hypothetical protein